MKSLTALIRQRSGRAVLEALKAARRNHRHRLVLYLATEEPRPSKAWLSQFDHVVDAAELVDVRARLRSFADDHAIFHVLYADRDDGCTLTFNTLGGSQQFTDTFLEARAIAQECLKSGKGLVLEEENETPRSRTLCVRQRSWQELHAFKKWAKRTCIWIRGDGCRMSGAGYGSLCLADHSTENVIRLAHDIKAGRPFMARRTGHLKRR